MADCRSTFKYSLDGVLVPYLRHGHLCEEGTMPCHEKKTGASNVALGKRGGGLRIMNGCGWMRLWRVCRGLEKAAL